MSLITFGLVDTLVLGGKTTAVISSIGTNLIIKTITGTTSAIGNVLDYLTTSREPAIKSIISQLQDIDLEFTISIIEEVIKEQNNKELSDSVKKVLIGLNEILSIIHKELDSIKDTIENHSKKYFSSWRKFNCSVNIETIKKHNTILKSRYNIMIDLLKIYN